MTSSGLDVSAGGGAQLPSQASPASPPAAAKRRRAPSNPPMGAWRRGVREVGLGLITAGVIILLFVLYQLVGTNFAEQSSQSQLAREFQQALAHAGSATPANAGLAPSKASPAPAAPGAPVAGAIDHLVIPKIGVDKYVVEGVSESNLQQGPGHYPQTVMPGQVGNSGIAGHRTTYGAPFFRLNELAPGDPIEITDAKGQHFTYLVTGSEVVKPSDVSVLDNTPNVAELTLTTCNPRFEAVTRLVVVAKLQKGAKPLAPATPATPQPASLGSSAALNLGEGNASAWPAVALYGALVVAGWALVRLLINRTRRWRRVGAYVGGIAVCLVPLWFLFENVVRLLPPNI